jgi:hypothetical protein
VKNSDFFESIPQTATKVGPYNAFYPLYYRDTSQLVVIMLAPFEKIRSILPLKRMHPFRLTLWYGKVLQYQYCPPGQAILTTVIESYPI